VAANITSGGSKLKIVLGQTSLSPTVEFVVYFRIGFNFYLGAVNLYPPGLKASSLTRFRLCRCNVIAANTRYQLLAVSYRTVGA